MAPIPANGEKVDFDSRDQYRVRKKKSRLERQTKSADLLKRRVMELHNRTNKQTRRWIRHVVESANRGGMPKAVEKELLAYTRKLQEEQNKLSLVPELSCTAREFWRTLQNQREAAMVAQSQEVEAVDWWVEASGQNVGGKKLRRTIQSIEERIKQFGVKGGEQDNDEDEDEGGVPLAGSRSPFMLSPMVSPPLGEEEQSSDLVLVLPLR